MDFAYFEIQGKYHGVSISLGDKNLPNIVAVQVTLSSPVHSASFTVLAVVLVMHFSTNKFGGRSGFKCFVVMNLHKQFILCVEGEEVF